jgi:hypothetical protein
MTRMYNRPSEKEKRTTEKAKTREDFNPIIHGPKPDCFFRILQPDLPPSLPYREREEKCCQFGNMLR